MKALLVCLLLLAGCTRVPRPKFSEVGRMGIGYYIDATDVGRIILPPDRKLREQEFDDRAVAIPGFIMVDPMTWLWIRSRLLHHGELKK